MKSEFPLALAIPLAFMLGTGVSQPGAGVLVETIKVVRTERIEIVDSAGNVIGQWSAQDGGSSLQVGSSTNSPTCTLRTGATGGVHVLLKNPSTETTLGAGINPSGVIEAVGKGPRQARTSNPRLEVVLGNYPNFMFRVCDEDGKAVLTERTREERK